MKLLTTHITTTQIHPYWLYSHRNTIVESTRRKSSANHQEKKNHTLTFDLGNWIYFFRGATVDDDDGNKMMNRGILSGVGTTIRFTCQSESQQPHHTTNHFAGRVKIVTETENYYVIKL